MAYPTEAPPAGPGGRIEHVVDRSPAQLTGLVAGETVLAVDGHALRDVLDWLWHADGRTVSLTVLDTAGAVRDARLHRDWDQPWGLTFAGVVFDGVRECDNACAFCFVGQLPQGLRPSLYVRDDDFRLSFLTGNYVTLTNMSDEDIERILTQRLTPLYVSLHAVDADVRRSLMCAPVEDRALEFVDRLLAGGIELHVQIVLVPGVNDGPALQRTVAWCAERPGVQSVGIVPVGLTRYQERVLRSYNDPEDARAVLEEIEPWRERMHGERGVRWVHAADELYLAAGEPIPLEEEYDDFPQYENGIGMVRAFIDELGALVDDAVLHPEPRVGATLVTGELFAPVLRVLAPLLATFGVTARVMAVPNRLLGGNVDVAGLLGGDDIAQAIVADAEGGEGPYLVPAVAVNDAGLFLDDVTLDRLRDLTHSDVRLVSSDAAGLARALSAIAAESSG